MEVEEIPHNYFPSNLKWLRRHHRMSQEELANKVGLKRGNISSYESGMAEPKYCNLQKIAAVFNLSIVRLREQPFCCEQDLKKAKRPSVGLLDSVVVENKRKKIDEISVVIESLKNCANYHIKSLDSEDFGNLALSTHFMQLYKCSQELLAECKTLLGEDELTETKSV